MGMNLARCTVAIIERLGPPGLVFISPPQYTLETYCEGRSTGSKYEPFRGGQVDGPENGTPPPPWEIECTYDKLFLDHTKKLEVPHTAHVQVSVCL